MSLITIGGGAQQKRLSGRGPLRGGAALPQHKGRLLSADEGPGTDCYWTDDAAAPPSAASPSAPSRSFPAYPFDDEGPLTEQGHQLPPVPLPADALERTQRRCL